jgi:hypothetical protein
MTSTAHSRQDRDDRTVRFAVALAAVVAIASIPTAHAALRLDVVFHPGLEAPAHREALIEHHGGCVVHSFAHLPAATIEIPASAVAALLDDQDVAAVLTPLPPLSPMNNDARVSSQGEAVQAGPYNLTGAGVTVMIYDLYRPRATHVDFAGRLTLRDAESSVDNHPTHVAGTIGGSGAASGGLYRGLAPAVQIDSYVHRPIGGADLSYLSDSGDMESDFRNAILQSDADLGVGSLALGLCASPSIPCTISGDYGLTSAMMDEVTTGVYVRSLPLFWSAGHERSPDCGGRCTDVPGGHIGPGYHSLAPPVCAKNPILVGAVYSGSEAMTDFSSWGPTDDGRLKPDLVAPGAQTDGDGGITSTGFWNDTSYVVRSGTSAAAAVAAGSAALLIEDFYDRYPALPRLRNSTIKALLLHTAADKGAPGPDYQYGYGALRIKSAIDLMRSGAFREETIADGGVFTRTHVVSPGTPELRVTIAWDDPPVVAGDSTYLVNDLDLRVIAPGGAVHYPWTLDPNSPATPAVRTQADRRNNVEQVYVANPPAGTWTVEVRGHSLPQGPQPFAIAGAGASIAQVLLSWPSAMPTSLQVGVSTIIHVQLDLVADTLQSGSARLFYRYGPGSFASVSLLPLGDGLYRGVLPPPPCTTAPAELYARAVGVQSGPVTLPAAAPAEVVSIAIGSEVVLLSDNFETNNGWTVNHDPVISGGMWQRGVPSGDGTRGAPTTDYDGSGQCWLTENGDGNTDVDNGTTRLISPVFSTNGRSDLLVGYALWYTNYTGSAPNADTFVVRVSGDGGGSWHVADVVGPATGSGWQVRSFRPADVLGPTATIRVRFDASDLGEGSIVEAAVDAFRLYYLHCEGLPGDATGDFDGDGDVDMVDATALLGCYGQPAVGGCAPGDLSGGGTIDAADWAEFADRLTGPI